jgi:hypothetical protein
MFSKNNNATIGFQDIAPYKPDLMKAEDFHANHEDFSALHILLFRLLMYPLKWKHASSLKTICRTQERFLKNHVDYRITVKNKRIK